MAVRLAIRVLLNHIDEPVAWNNCKKTVEHWLDSLPQRPTPATGNCTCMADAYCKVHGNVPKPAHASEPIDWTAHDKAQRDYAASEDARCRAHASEPKCANCGKPATCFGQYEDCPAGYACDDCCGHGNEDGHCEPIKPAHASEPWTVETDNQGYQRIVSGGGFVTDEIGHPSKTDLQPIADAHNATLPTAHASEPWTVVGGFSDTTEMCWHKIDFGNGEHMMLHETPAAIHRLLEVHNATLSQRPSPATDDTKRLDWLNDAAMRMPNDVSLDVILNQHGWTSIRSAIDAAMSQTKERK